jgi:hypothetical protein
MIIIFNDKSLIENLFKKYKSTDIKTESNNIFLTIFVSAKLENDQVQVITFFSSKDNKGR